MYFLEVIRCSVASLQAGIDRCLLRHCHSRTKRENVFLNLLTLGAATAMQ
jgi:hypothetical protein